MSLARSTIEPEEPRKVWTLDMRLGLHTDGGLDFGASYFRKSRIGLYAGLQTGSYDESFSVPDFFGESEPFDFTSSLSASRAYGGVSYRFGRRYP